MIAGTFPPSDGQVRFRGKRLNGRPAHERVRLGIVRTFQQAFTFSDMTVLENVMVGCHLKGQAGILDAALRLPRAAARRRTVAGQPALPQPGGPRLPRRAAGRALPFGQQRLLAIARALACEPAVDAF